MIDNLFNDPQVTAAVQSLLLAFLTAFFTLAGAGIRIAYKNFTPLVELYLNEKIEANRLEMIKNVAATVVRSLAQSPAFRNFSGSDLFKYAITYIDGVAKSYGYDFDEELLGHMIEAAVQAMKAELGEDPELAKLIDFLEKDPAE